MTICPSPFGGVAMLVAGSPRAMLSALHRCFSALGLQAELEAVDDTFEADAQGALP